jgi:hypothetical protein
MANAAHDPTKGNANVVARAALQRSVRAAIRLRHSLPAYAELAERLPAILEAFDSAVLAGEPFEFDIGSLLDPPKPKKVVKPPPARRISRATSGAPCQRSR